MQKRVKIPPKKLYKNRLELFISDPKHPLLRDHLLRGEKLTLRAFWITGDIRVVYTKIGGRIIFLDIGTHNQIY